MTPDEQAAAEKAAADKAAAEQAAAKAKRAKLKRGALAQVVYRDQLTGRQVGPVVAVVTRGLDDGGLIRVRPVADHEVTVDTAEVEPVIVDEV